MTNGADTNCRTLRTQARISEGMPGSGGRGMNGQRLVSGQGIVRPTNTQGAPPGKELGAEPGKRTKAAKVTPGKRQTASKANKRKGKKK